MSDEIPVVIKLLEERAERTRTTSAHRNKRNRQATSKQALHKNAERPVRTREHYIEAVSRNFVEGFIVRKGHAVDEPRPDYGYDIVVTTFDYKGDTTYRSGEVENGSLYIQLKATDTLAVLADGHTISFDIKRRHAVYWMNEPNPVYLVVYSVQDNTAYLAAYTAIFESGNL